MKRLISQINFTLEKPIKIALLTNGVWPHVIGGMQKHSYYLCKYLSREGLKVHLYHTLQNADAKSSLSNYFDETELSNIEEFLILYPQPHSFPGHYLYESYKYSKNIYFKLEPLIEQYDLLYVQGLSGWFTINKQNKLKGFPPIILNLHGLEMFQKPWSFKGRFEQWMFRPFVMNLLKRADYIHTLGKRLTQLLLERGIKPRKFVEVGIGIEKKWLIHKIAPSAQRRVFTFIGRYQRLKGIVELTSVLRKLMGRYDFEFHFIGPIPDKAKLNSPKIVYHGLINQQDFIKDILALTDFLVVPSYTEGMPTVILEAMSSGCAVIASDVGAVNELVSEKNGILITPGDTTSLYKAMEEGMIMDQSTLQQMKQYAIQQVEKQFTWEVVIKRMIAEFLSIIQRN